jgi:hypothetical protein
MNERLFREDQERKHELGINYALEDLKRAGFTILKQQDPFADRSKGKGDKMWLVVAVKNDFVYSSIFQMEYGRLFTE